LAGGEKDVKFTLGWERRQLPGESDEVVGDSGHSGDDNDDRVTCLLGIKHAAGDILNALGCAKRGSSIFLYHKGHESWIGTDCRLFIRRFQDAADRGEIR